MKLTEKKTEVGRVRRLALTGVCVALGLATAGSTLALGLALDQQATVGSYGEGKTPLSVPSQKMAEMVVKKETPKYPIEAKKARVQGTVVLRALIGKSGRVVSLKADSGPSELQASALAAVRRWEYKPYLVNGKPVEVQTTINVIYSLEK